MGQWYVTCADVAVYLHYEDERKRNFRTLWFSRLNFNDVFSSRPKNKKEQQQQWIVLRFMYLYICRYWCHGDIMPPIQFNNNRSNLILNSPLTDDERAVFTDLKVFTKMRASNSSWMSRDKRFASTKKLRYICRQMLWIVISALIADLLIRHIVICCGLRCRRYI